MKEKIISLNPDELLKLSMVFEVLTFKNDFTLVYEDQVPSAGIALLEGQIELIKNSLSYETITPGHLLGIYQLLSGRSVKYSCKVKAGSKIVLMGKSEILSYIKDKTSQLFPISLESILLAKEKEKIQQKKGPL